MAPSLLVGKITDKKLITMKAKDISEIIKKLAPPELAYEGEEIGFIVGDENKEDSGGWRNRETNHKSATRSYCK